MVILRLGPSKNVRMYHVFRINRGRKSGLTAMGNLEHLFVPGGCPSLTDARLSMITMINSYLVPRPHLFRIFKLCFDPQSPELLMQFLLDCSVIPEVIVLCQETAALPTIKDIFYLTRTYVFKVHCDRRRILANDKS